jgi:hypothetical protein
MGDYRPHWGSVIQLGAVLFGALLFSVPLVVLTGGIGVGEAAPVVVAEPKRVGIGGYEEVMAALRGAGGMVKPAGEFSEPFFRAGGRVVDVDGTLVLVFEYSNERDREAESELISADGSSVGSTHITWTDQPNFWAGGRVIVQYLGSDHKVLGLLHNALGAPITIHEQISAE